MMEKASGIRILYVPCGSEEEAHSLAVKLLDRRLIACANIYASRSVYRWKGELAEETEHVVFAKTTAAVADEALSAAEKLHNYDVPCVLLLEPICANTAYEAWVAGEVSPGAVERPNR